MSKSIVGLFALKIKSENGKNVSGNDYVMYELINLESTLAALPNSECEQDLAN